MDIKIWRNAHMYIRFLVNEYAMESKINSTLQKSDSRYLPKYKIELYDFSKMIPNLQRFY